MAIKLGSNIASLNGQRRLAEAGTELSKTFERLSSGQRINRASDDAAGLAIADSLKAKSRVYTQAIRNGNDGISLLNIADSAIDALTSVVVRIRELSEQSANGTYSSKQREALDLEAQQLSKEFTRITQSTTFNGIKLFNGSLGDGVRLQLGYGTSESINASIGGAVGTGNFANANLFSATGVELRDIELADFNNDGILDMVTTGGGVSVAEVVVKLGLGNGNFGTQSIYTFNPIINSPTAVAVGDLNGDNNLDIVTGGYGGQINVRLGNGNGTFANAVTYSVLFNNTIQDVVLGDLNGDGILDMVTAGYNFSDSVDVTSIRLGVGNGTFSAASIITSSINVAGYAAKLSDLNSDGNLDLITTGIGIGVGKVVTRFGTGSGSFGVETIYSSTGSALSIDTGDLNGDGILDLVTAGYDQTSGTHGVIEVRLGSSNGTFGNSTSYSQANIIAWDVKLTDLNQDGMLDIVTGNNTASGGTISTMLGNGRGAFNYGNSYTSEGTSSKAVAFGDINGDGVVDLVSSGYGSSHSTSSIFLASTKEGLGALQAFSLKTKSSSRDSMIILDNTLQNLAKQRGTIGASQSRVNIAIQNLQTSRENFLAAESRIRDADIAQESANLVRTQILQQAAVSVLSQANQQPSLAIQLLS